METSKPKIKLVIEGEDGPIELGRAVALAKEEVEGFDDVFIKLNSPAGSPLMRVERAAIASYVVGKLTGAY
jgi:hypothetical protein